MAATIWVKISQCSDGAPSKGQVPTVGMGRRDGLGSEVEWDSGEWTPFEPTDEAGAGGEERVEVLVVETKGIGGIAFKDAQKTRYQARKVKAQEELTAGKPQEALKCNTVDQGGKDKLIVFAVEFQCPRSLREG